MSALFDEDIIGGTNEKASEEEGFSYDSEEKDRGYTHARRKLEDILEEKRLRRELEDFLD